MFGWKPGRLIPDLYLYSIKIPTDINQNTVIKLQQNHIYFFIIFKKFYNNFFSYIYIYIIQNNIYIYIIILNRAGPAQTTGPDSAQNQDGPRSAQKCTGPISAQKCTGPISAQKNVLGRSRPKNVLGRSWPKTNSLLGQDPPDPATKRARGINFPPPLHAERYSFCMQRRK